jgi:hypothetical protein
MTMSDGGFDDALGQVELGKYEAADAAPFERSARYWTALGIDPRALVHGGNGDEIDARLDLSGHLIK